MPPDADLVGWFTGGPTPGELGPAVIVGHVDWAGTQGVFYDLRDLQPGNEITITRADARRHLHRALKQTVPRRPIPTAAVYGNIDHAGLRLITCGGSLTRPRAATWTTSSFSPTLSGRPSRSQDGAA